MPIGSLPETLTHLIFGQNYNQYISPSQFPPNLLYLNFGAKFSQECILNFPNKILWLAFGKYFNQKLDISGCSKLRTLKLSNMYAYHIQRAKFEPISNNSSFVLVFTFANYFLKIGFNNQYRNSRNHLRA